MNSFLGTQEKLPHLSSCPSPSHSLTEDGISRVSSRWRPSAGTLRKNFESDVTRYQGQRVFGAFIAWLVVLIVSCGPADCLAGGGPENLVLVVNADSASSKMIANWYVAQRNIPARNVIYLNEIPARETTTLSVFRNKILKPVLRQIDERKIGGTVDYIVYSSDFPTMVSINEHVAALTEEFKAQKQSLPGNIFGAEASITSLTYFAGAVLGDQPGYVLLDANTYYRNNASVLLRRPFVGDRQKEFETATAAFDGSDEEFSDAIESLEEMAKANPRQVAVLYWLARFYAQSGNAKKATDWLIQAVRMGWSFRDQTESDLAFSKIKDNPLFSGIVKRIPDEPFDFVPSHGFKQIYSWGLNGMLNSEPGQGNRYFLSTILAVTRNYGNSEKEALRQLKISAGADESHPDGTFYFSDTSDVRNTTRKPNYAMAMKTLSHLGFNSEIIKSDLPQEKRDVLGLTTGSSSYNWTATGSRIMPGAICENLTSYGGTFHAAGQTKLSEFLKHGAAGSSGTVTEPYALQAKFPHPLIHAHYASGCSLAEAFYQSVAGPFQLIIVGDALCQPFATRPAITVSGIAPNGEIAGTVKLNMNDSASPVSIAGLEFYVDGILVFRGQMRETIAFDTTGISDGYHELRFVTVASNAIETTGRVVIPILVNNQGVSTQLTSSRTEYLETDTIKLNAKSDFGDSIELMYNMRPLAKKIGRDVEFEIPATLVGRGPVKLEAVSIDETGAGVSSLPLELMIEGSVSDRKEMTEVKK